MILHSKEFQSKFFPCPLVSSRSLCLSLSVCRGGGGRGRGRSRGGRGRVSFWSSWLLSLCVLVLVTGGIHVTDIVSTYRGWCLVLAELHPTRSSEKRHPAALSLPAQPVCFSLRLRARDLGVNRSVSDFFHLLLLVFTASAVAVSVEVSATWPLLLALLLVLLPRLFCCISVASTTTTPTSAATSAITTIPHGSERRKQRHEWRPNRWGLPPSTGQSRDEPSKRRENKELLGITRARGGANCGCRRPRCCCTAQRSTRTTRLLTRGAITLAAPASGAQSTRTVIVSTTTTTTTTPVTLCCFVCCSHPALLFPASLVLVSSFARRLSCH